MSLSIMRIILTKSIADKVLSLFIFCQEKVPNRVSIEVLSLITANAGGSSKIILAFSSLGGHIYEIKAEWDADNGYGGIAYYSFYADYNQ